MVKENTKQENTKQENTKIPENDTKLYTNFFQENKMNYKQTKNDKQYTEIKPIPFIKNPKSQKNMINWLYNFLYDDYNRLYFIEIMFENMLTILNEQEYFYKNGDRDKIFTEFINWCYYNSYDN
jgi:hypothetical protein